jgi:hypothetical protein
MLLVTTVAKAGSLRTGNYLFTLALFLIITFLATKLAIFVAALLTLGICGTRS